MKKSELKQLIKEEILNTLNEEKSLTVTKTDGPSILNMRKVYSLLKSQNYNPKIIKGSIFNIKTIEIEVPNAGEMKISSDGLLYGDNNWGSDINNENEIIQRIEDYKVDQKLK